MIPVSTTDGRAVSQRNNAVVANFSNYGLKAVFTRAKENRLIDWKSQLPPQPRYYN